MPRSIRQRLSRCGIAGIACAGVLIAAPAGSASQIASAPAGAAAPAGAGTTASPPAAAPRRTERPSAPAAPSPAKPAPALTPPINNSAPPPPQPFAKLVLPVSASPASLDFGELWSGDAPRQKTVNVGVGADGNAAVTLQPGKPFRIVKMEIYGFLQKNPAVAQKPIMAQGPKLDPMKGGGPSQGGGFVPKPPAPTVQQPPAAPQGSPQQALHLTSGQTLLASTAAAPFTLPAKQGDRVQVTLEFAPDPNLFSGTPVGAHKGSLAVGGGGWRADVPLQASYAGLRIGIIGTIDDKQVDIVYPESYVPNQAHALNVNLSLVSAEQKSQQVQVAVSKLPSWLKFSGQTITVPAGKTVKTPLALQITGFNNVPSGKKVIDVPVELSLQYGGTVKKLPFSLRIVPGVFAWHFSDGGSWSADLTIRPDGRFTLFFHCPKNQAFEINHKCFAYYYLGGQQLGALFVGDEQTKSWGSTSPYVAQQYIQLIQSTPYVKAPEEPNKAKATYGVP